MAMKIKEDQDIGALIKGRIRDIKDYPKKGIIFRDITPLLKDSEAFGKCVEELSRRLSGIEFDYIVGIEARGFIIGSALAYRMKKGFVPIRKKGKLPYDKISRDYKLEYGIETVEVHMDSIKEGNKVVIVDDLLATGGTASASKSLVTELGGKVQKFAFIVELSELNGRHLLGDENVISLVKY
jgi:adenine phosphoribosyltransferase